MKKRNIRPPDLLARTVEEGDCLLWTGVADQGKFPKCFRGGVRRVLWELMRGPVPEGLQVGCNCGTLLCVKPDHLIVRTKSKALRGIPKSPMANIRNALTQRERRGKITMEIARQIRASDEPNRALDHKYGLPKGKSWKIRKNLVWKDMASPFAGLGAR